MACCWFLNEGVENNWLSDLTLLYYHNVSDFLKQFSAIIIFTQFENLQSSSHPLYVPVYENMLLCTKMWIEDDNYPDQFPAHFNN